MVKRYSTRQIRRTLGKFDLVESELPLENGVVLKIAEVEDSYVLLDRLIEQEGNKRQTERFPYWAEVWPASLGLARWFCRAEMAPPPAGTIELGCGLGVVGIALALLGWRVEATDYVEDALIFASYNAQLNGVVGRHQVGYLDWSNPAGSPVECMVAADIVYEKKNHPYLARVLRELLRPGGHFILGDPGRQPAVAFVDMLVKQGYDHRRERIIQPWKSLEHKIEVHIFRKPSSD